MERLIRETTPPQTGKQKARRRGRFHPQRRSGQRPRQSHFPHTAPWPSGPSLAAPGTHVWVSISEEFVEHVAELPAEHSVAGEGQPVDDRPKGLCPFLMVGAQYAR